MSPNSITSDRPSVPQVSPTPNGGGESFQVAYARVFDGRDAPVVTAVVPERPLQAQPEAARPVKHTVHAGDTLSGIARARLAAMGVATGTAAVLEGVAQLAKANNIRNPDRIYVGQKLDLGTLDAAYDRNQAAAARARATVLHSAVSPFDDIERIASRYEIASSAQWHQEDWMPADDVQVVAGAPAQLPAATPAFLPVVALAETDTAIAPLPPIEPMAVRQVALYEQNAASAPDKPAAPASALPDILYKGIAGKVLDAMPIEPSTRVALQRANAIVSSTFTVRSLGALTGFGGPLLTVAGLLWGIFSSRQIEAAPAGDAKPVADSNPVADTKQTAQTRVADARN